jgi:hypothetical protein
MEGLRQPRSVARGLVPRLAAGYTKLRAGDKPPRYESPRRATAFYAQSKREGS